MNYTNLEHCAELVGSIQPLLACAGIRLGKDNEQTIGDLWHALGNFKGARLLVEEENHSERACRICIEAERALGVAIIALLGAIKGALLARPGKDAGRA